MTIQIPPPNASIDVRLIVSSVAVALAVASRGVTHVASLAFYFVRRRQKQRAKSTEGRRLVHVRRRQRRAAWARCDAVDDIVQARRVVRRQVPAAPGQARVRRETFLTIAKTRFFVYTAAASDLSAERATERVEDLQYRCGVLLGGNEQLR